MNTQEWRFWLKLYAPMIATAIVSVLGVIYTAGHEAGKRTVLTAALESAAEAHDGVFVKGAINRG